MYRLMPLSSTVWIYKLNTIVRLNFAPPWLFNAVVCDGNFYKVQLRCLTVRQTCLHWRKSLTYLCVR